MKKLIIANWKMNPETMEQARILFMSIEHRMHLLSNKTDVTICPPNIYMAPFSHYSHSVKLGAQNIATADVGAFTGEVSAAQLKQWDIEFAILGHSERRLYFGETDMDVNQKISIALKHKIHPVVCLGGAEGAKKIDMKRLVTKQFGAVTKGLEKSDIAKIIFVYEPIWAISTMKNSKPATGAHALELITHIQTLLGKKVGKAHAEHMKILYGGTVNKSNVTEFAKHPIIGGALVGSASLESENFWGIIQEFARESIHR